ncbi:FAD-binding oxidoreductase [Streptomyces sp. BE20]|uniref:FAD-binding oxidoreductase n=1 Tax=Streptomyces sp. BE20 TaxID=3002525 RepID=UPI002E778E23|nr:FAD-binding oxidoreductase [Streptomyces sp. BE20]MEE1821392.1 FAD-binding oxidoreductase [Streptomyces sp. BE20]
MTAAGVSAASLGLTAGAAGRAEADPVELPEGRTVFPSDSRYETLSQGFNQRWRSRPNHIRLVGNEADAVAELRTTLDRGLRPTVRGGGHCYEGFVDNDKGVILDLSTLRGVRTGTDKFGAATYCVEGGATNWDVYTTLFRTYGVTIPAGSCYSVGAGGHIGGGGYGLLSRRHGLTVDHLVQVDVVTVRGGRVEVTTAHRGDPEGSPERELFWAHTGGGGGNFGIVLRYHFAHALPKPPPQVWLSSVAWPWDELVRRPEDFRTLLDNFGAFFARYSGRKETVYQGLFSILHLTHRSNGNVVLFSQWDEEDPAPLDEFLALVESGMRTRSTIQTRSAGRLYLPYPDKRRRLPWFQATMTVNGSGANQRGKYKSAYHRRPFTPAQIESFWTWLTREVPGVDLTNTLVQIDSYGCRVNDRGPTETAAPQRDSVMKLQYQTYWTDPAADADHLAFLRGLYRDAYRATGGVPEIGTNTDGAYVNYPDIDLGVAGDDRPAYQRLYYKQNYARLQRAKKLWDDKNVFHHAQSVTLPS